GSFSLAPVLNVIQSLSGLLNPTRTPRIILAASEGGLKEVDGRTIVPRGRKPVVPRDWLLRGYVFADGGTCWFPDPRYGWFSGSSRGIPPVSAGEGPPAVDLEAVRAHLIENKARWEHADPTSTDYQAARG